jgi:hypothetical protein
MEMRVDRRNWASRLVGQPEPGYFLIHLVRKGPLVPARIIHNPDAGSWQAIVDGCPQRAATDPAAAPMVFPIWHGGQMISEAEYLRAMKARGEPDAPPARVPINLTSAPPLF